MSAGERWQTIPDDIVFLVMDIVDRLDFLESDDTLPRIWELRVPEESTFRTSRRVKPGILAIRQTCTHWRAVASTRSSQWPYGVTFIRWDEQLSEDPERQANEIKESLMAGRGDSDMEILANINTVDGLHAFSTILVDAFAKFIRRLWLHPHFVLGKTWELKSLPRLKGLSIWGSQKLLPSFQESARLPELLSLELWQCSNDTLLSKRLCPETSNVTWLCLNLDMEVETIILYNIDSPSLRRLALSCTRSEQAAAALRSIIAPNLQELELDLQSPLDDHPSMLFDIDGVHFPRLVILWLSSFPICLALKIYESLKCKKLDLLTLKLRPTDTCFGHDYPTEERQVQIEVKQLSIRSRPGFFPHAQWEWVLSQLMYSANFINVEELYLEVAWSEDLSILQLPGKYFKLDTLKKLIAIHDGVLASFELGGHIIPPSDAEETESSDSTEADSTSAQKQKLLEIPPNMLSIPGRTLTTNLVLRCSHTHADWLVLNQVDRLVIMVYDFSSDNVQTLIRILRELRGGPKAEDPRSPLLLPTGPISTLKQAAARLVRSVTSPVRMAIASSKYPELQSLTIHALDPHPIKFTPVKIVEELKSLVRQRKKSKGALKEIVLRLPPEGKNAMGWFAKHAVTCVVTNETEYQKIPFEPDVDWCF